MMGHGYRVRPMVRRFAALAMVLATVGAGALVSTPAHAGWESDLGEAQQALSAWDIPAAERAYERANKRRGTAGDDLAGFILGRLRLMQSRYPEAVAAFNKLSPSGLPPSLRRVHARFKEIATSTAAVTKGYALHKTSGGHFEIAYAPGIDEVLIPYADRMLEQAWTSLTTLFGHEPRAPIRVEIYPQVDALAKVSSLTSKEIKTSGTIALCKYNRLMIISPRDLVYGYSWLDTLGHEFIHLLITQKSRNLVPIWLHEGLAKYYEATWKGNSATPLSRHSENLLARALAADTLIPFEAMSPSMAKLPSQEATATAFAEVHTVIEFLETKSGPKVASELPRLMGTGIKDKQAVALLAKIPWKRFESSWRTFLKGKGLRTLKANRFKDKLLFKGDDTEAAELAELGEKKARDHAWLGDRLGLKGRFKAAAKQYRKAAKYAGPATAIVQAKLGFALLQLGQVDAAIVELRKPLAQASSYVLLHLYLGEAYVRTGRFDLARKHLEDAIALNPFDPSVHGHLATVFTKLKMLDRAAEERRLHDRVNGSKP